MENLDSISQIHKFLRRPGPMAVLFYTEWCPLSLIMRNSFERVAFKIRSLTCGKCRLDLLGKSDLVLPIYSTPALSLFYQSELCVSFIEVKPPEELEALLTNFVRSHSATASASAAKGRSPSGRLLLRLSFASDFLQHKHFSRVKVLDFDCGNCLHDLSVDRATTVVLLFLTYARRKSPGLALLDKGGVTGRGAEVLRGMRRLYRLGPAQLVGIEKRDSDDQQGAYVSKNISRINKFFKAHIGRNVIAVNGSGYMLSEDIEIEVLQGG